jgi:hypothetical protein
MKDLLIMTGEKFDSRIKFFEHLQEVYVEKQDSKRMEKVEQTIKDMMRDTIIVEDL